MNGGARGFWSGGQLFVEPGAELDEVGVFEGGEESVKVCRGRNGIIGGRVLSGVGALFRFWCVFVRFWFLGRGRGLVVFLGIHPVSNDIHLSLCVDYNRGGFGSIKADIACMANRDLPQLEDLEVLTRSHNKVTYASFGTFNFDGAWQALRKAGATSCSK